MTDRLELDEEAMITEYLRGDTLDVIGRRHGVSPVTINNRLRRVGVALRPQGRRGAPRAATAVELQALYREVGRELSEALLARWAGCQVQTIQRHQRWQERRA